MFQQNHVNEMSFWVIAAAVIIGSLVYKIVFGTTCENVENCRVDDSDAINSSKKKKKVLVLTAHPDDECMFFAPTILRLRKKGIEVSLLCMTTGTVQLQTVGGGPFNFCFNISLL